MAFDEDFHLGIIQIYAHHLSPFFASQPAGADAFGPIARDPSYLYHWLMSFPWRLITALTSNFMTQVILMRLINIGLFSTALVLMRKLLGKTKAAPALINLAMMFFVLTPLVPQVAAQINYDNLLLVVAPLIVLLAVKFKEHLDRRQFNWWLLAGLLIVGLLGSLVKYAFLPFFAAVVLWLAWDMYRRWHTKPSAFWVMLRQGYKKLGTIAKAVAIVGVIVSGGLFFERYGINTIDYGTPIPECNQVLSLKQCASFGAWERNYQFKQSKTHKSSDNPLVFSYWSARNEAFNLMFALNGRDSGFMVGYPLVLPRLLARAIGYSSPLLLLLFWKKIFASRTMRLLALVSVVYLAALWLKNYMDYLNLGQRVGIQGRYLLPILPFVYLGVAMGFAQLLARAPNLRMVLLTSATIMFVLGGGVLTFIMQSGPSWYWPNPGVLRANQDLQHFLKPIIPGANPTKS